MNRKSRKSLKHLPYSARNLRYVELPIWRRIQPVPKKIVPIIFDTDLGSDYDDVGALTMLHALADKGEADILATVSCNVYPNTVQYIDVINQYYGRPDIPVGTARKGVNVKDGYQKKFAETLLRDFPHKNRKTEEIPDAVQVYRSVLAGQHDASVTIVTVGFLTNLSALLQSSSDQFSELTGAELVKKKVKRLVSMGGQFPNGKDICNLVNDRDASMYVFEHWPSQIVLSGAEIGDEIITGKRLITSSIPNTPAKKVYAVCMNQDEDVNGDKRPNGRQSWDQTAVLVVVRGTYPYFGSVRGRMRLAPKSKNDWEDDPNGKHEYLTWKMPVDELTTVIEDLMMHEPVVSK